MSRPLIRLLDRAKETTTTTGSGDITLGGAVGGFIPISGIGNGNSTYYTLEEVSSFEVGIGTYSSGDNTFSRDEIFVSSNEDNSKIGLSGNATIFITYPADKAVVKTSGNLVGIGIDPEYPLHVSGISAFDKVYAGPKGLTSNLLMINPTSRGNLLLGDPGALTVPDNASGWLIMNHGFQHNGGVISGVRTIDANTGNFQEVRW